VLEHEPQEVLAFEGATAGFAGTALHVPEGDMAVFTGNDIFFRDDAPV